MKRAALEELEKTIGRIGFTENIKKQIIQKKNEVVGGLSKYEEPLSVERYSAKKWEIKGEDMREKNQ